MTELKMEHVLMVLIVAFVLYYFMGSCSCGNGFSVGGEGDCTDAGIYKFIDNVKNIRDCTISDTTGELTECGPRCYDIFKTYHQNCESEIEGNEFMNEEFNKVGKVCMEQNPVSKDTGFLGCVEKYQMWYDKNKLKDNMYVDKNIFINDCITHLINTPECIDYSDTVESLCNS